MYSTEKINKSSQLKFIDQFLLGNKGFIAGGCFKSIFAVEAIAYYLLVEHLLK